MENTNTRILSIDAGGVKGIYTAYIINEINTKYEVDFSSSFNHYAGTSIGAVIASALAIQIPPIDILKGFLRIQDLVELQHPNLINRLFLWIDELFQDKKFGVVKRHLFVPVYNFSCGSIDFFSSTCTAHQEISIAEVLKSACSDIRIVGPYEIANIGKYGDAGFFAYDPIMYFLRTKQIIETSGIHILSIGSGLIENFSNDLSQGDSFDMIYDTFLFDQFATTKFYFDTITKLCGLKYFRISEFPHRSAFPLSIDYILQLADERLKRLSKRDFISYI